MAGKWFSEEENLNSLSEYDQGMDSVLKTAYK